MITTAGRKLTRHPVPTIAIDLTPLLPGGDNGGAQHFVRELIRGLARHAPQADFVLLTHAVTHEELVCLEAANVRRLRVAGATLTGKPSSLRQLQVRLGAILPVRLRQMLVRIAYGVGRYLRRRAGQRILRQCGAQLLFCPFTAPIFEHPAIPTVCTVNDLQFVTYPEFFTPEDRAYRASVLQDACRHAAMLVAISDYSRDTVLRHGRIDAARVVTIPLRLAHRLPTNAYPGAVLERFGLQARRYLLYPANFWLHKNHERLLSAYVIARRNGLPDDIKLVLTGAPGVRSKTIARAIAAAGLTDRVLQPGYVSNEDLAALLGNATALVFPSLYEGFGMPVLEAMAAGIPVACSAVCSLPEVAGQAAVYFDPTCPNDIARALGAVSSDTPENRQRVAAGYQQAAQYAATERMVRDYWRVFTTLLAC